MKKPLVIAFALLVFVLVAFSLFWRFSGGFSREVDDLEQQKVQQESEIYEYSGRVSEIGIDYFVMKLPVMPEKLDESTLEEDYEPEFLRVVVYIPDNLELVDVNDIQFIDVPEEYQGTLQALEYVMNLEDEEYGSYEIAVLVRSEDAINVYEGRVEITPTHLEWSCFPKGLF